MEEIMARKAAILTVFLALFAFYLPANAEDTYDINVKFWKEKFVGANGPGHLGNILMAVGEGWVFQNARLTEVGLSEGDNGVCESKCSDYRYYSIYEGGQLTLTKKGDWDENYKDSSITACNCSTFNNETQFLTYELTFAGDFKDGTPYTVTVNYSGYPRIQVDDETEDPIYQKGDGDIFIGEIIFDPDPIVPDNTTSPWPY
jgi:hypothetical protein